MKPLADPARMAAIEAAARDDYGIPESLLMEDAAIALETWLKEKGLPAPDDRLCVIAGRGNNGGDGLALATRLAHAGKKGISVVCVSGRRSPECDVRLKIAGKSGLKMIFWPEDAQAVQNSILGADILIDALCGTGLNSSLRSPELELAAFWLKSGARKIAVDLPSGFRALIELGDTVFAADDCLCIGLAKDCLYLPGFRSQAGRIHVLDGGVFPAALLDAQEGQSLLLEPVDIDAVLKLFPSDAYKKSRGSISVFAGSVGGVGAASLCAQAAARSGAGIVRLWVDKIVWSAAASGCGALVVKALEACDNFPAEETEAATGGACLLAGPGWSRDPCREKLLASLLPRYSRAVLDADALWALKGLDPARLPLPAQCVLTPHLGEAARLLDLSSTQIGLKPQESALTLARRYQAVIILKAAVTWIADPTGRIRVLDGSFPPLGTAGSGDVLTGIVAALLGRGLSALDAACLAVLIHADAGRRAWESKRYFMAQDLLDALPGTLRRAEGGREYA